MTATSHTLDVTTTDFTTLVIDRSREIPVLVDFWATWCGPCRALGPILERLAREYDGGFVLAKVDTDKEQALASQFQIRSIPTVMLFKDGAVVGAFPGALPEGQIRAFLTRYGVEPGGERPVFSDDPAERVEQLRAAVAADPARGSLQLELALALMASADDGAAHRVLEALPPALYGEPSAVRARARLALRFRLTGAPSAEALQHRLELHGDDVEAQYLLGVHTLLVGRTDVGLSYLLEALRAQKHDEASAARAALVEAFQCIEDEAVVRDARRKMASVLF